MLSLFSVHLQEHFTGEGKTIEIKECISLLGCLLGVWARRWYLSLHRQDPNGQKAHPQGIQTSKGHRQAMKSCIESLIQSLSAAGQCNSFGTGLLVRGSDVKDKQWIHTLPLQPRRHWASPATQGRAANSFRQLDVLAGILHSCFQNRRTFVTGTRANSEESNYLLHWKHLALLLLHLSPRFTAPFWWYCWTQFSNGAGSL